MFRVIWVFFSSWTPSSSLYITTHWASCTPHSRQHIDALHVSAGCRTPPGQRSGLYIRTQYRRRRYCTQRAR
ncbi:hypothetical protein GGF50DRAFT_97789 [Schizophyllum commune]